MKISNWIEAFRPAEGPPPQNLGAFMSWCLSGAWPALALAAFLSAASGALEAGTALILGMVIDSAANSAPESYFLGSNTALLIGSVVFFLLARPLLFGLSAGANAIIVQPNVTPLVLSRLHRWTLGQRSLSSWLPLRCYPRWACGRRRRRPPSCSGRHGCRP